MQENKMDILIPSTYDRVKKSRISRHILNKQYSKCYNKYHHSQIRLAKIFNNQLSNLIMSYVTKFDGDYNSKIWKCMESIWKRKRFTDATYKLFIATPDEISKNNIICFLKFDNPTNSLCICYVQNTHKNKFIIMKNDFEEIYDPKRIKSPYSDDEDSILITTEPKYIRFNRLYNSFLLTWNEVMLCMMYNKN